MVHIPKTNRKKWDKKANEMIFVGYNDNRKGYRCIDPKTRKLHVSRDGIFSKPRKLEQVQCIVDSSDDDHIESTINESKTANLDNTDHENNPTKNVTIANTSDEQYSDDEYEPTDDDEYVPSREPTISSEMRVTRAASKNPNSLNLLTFALLTAEPASANEIQSRGDKKDWLNAMEDEMKSHYENKTWTKSHLPVGRKPIKSKWVFKAKKNEDGKVVRYKARLVAKGFAQRYGIDYEETYAPVVRYASIRILMANNSAFIKWMLSLPIYRANSTKTYTWSSRRCSAMEQIMC